MTYVTITYLSIIDNEFFGDRVVMYELFSSTAFNSNIDNFDLTSYLLEHVSNIISIVIAYH